MKISIITVCYNSEKFIEQTILSVINQTYNNIEYIVVDGMSTDSTPLIISKYKDRITKIIREKDENMYDAINKGMAVSTGDYIEILNSDDVLYRPDSIQNVVTQISKYKDKYDVFYCDNIIHYQDFGLYKSRLRIQTNFRELLCSKQLGFVGHGDVFISRKVYESIGEYDCHHFSAAADYDYMLRAFKIFRCKKINAIAQVFRIHDESITSSGKIAKEIADVLTKNGINEISTFGRIVFYLWGWSKFCMVNLFPMLRFYYQKYLGKGKKED